MTTPSLIRPKPSRSVAVKAKLDKLYNEANPNFFKGTAIEAKLNAAQPVAAE